MLLAIAASVALQLETGYVHMSSAPDDFWYEQGLTHTTDFDSAAFGGGIKFGVRNLQLTLGWRNLGNQHQSAKIIGDAQYFACKGSGACPAATQYWTETGSEQQTFAELGYQIHLARGWKLVPSLGFAETRVTSHVNMFTCPQLKWMETGGGNVQHLPRGFAGAQVEKGAWGVGVQYLQTEPNRGANGWTSPIQGSTALYVRLTYAIPL